MNRHWLAECNGRRVVVRQSHVSRTAAAVAWEQALIAFAGEKGWPVAEAIASAADGTVIECGGRLWTAAPFLEGEPGRQDSPAQHTIYGRLLAGLHRDLASFPPGGQRPGFGKTWELDVMVEPAGEGSFNSLVSAFGQQYPALAASIRRQRYRNLRELSRLHYPDLPERPIHGDFGPWNLLFKEAQLAGIIDFDQSRRDALACDIAPLLMPFMPLDMRLVRAVLQGYESVRPLSDEEWALLPALVRAALLWWVASLLVRWRLEGGEPTGITRTMTVRFPAWDEAEAGLRTARTSRN